MAGPYAPTNSPYLLAAADATDLPQSSRLVAGTGLTLTIASPDSTIAASGRLSSLVGLSSSGVVCVNSATQTLLSRNIVSTGNTIAVTNPTGVSGNISLDVRNSTSTQKVIVAKSGTPISTQSTLDFIEGDNVTLNISNNPAGSATIVVSATNADGAPSTGSYITRTAVAGLTNNTVMSSLTTGLVKNQATTGIPVIAVDGTDYYGPASTIPTAQGGTGRSITGSSITDGDILIGDNANNNFKILQPGNSYEFPVVLANGTVDYRPLYYIQPFGGATIASTSASVDVPFTGVTTSAKIIVGRCQPLSSPSTTHDDGLVISVVPKTDTFTIYVNDVADNDYLVSYVILSLA